MGKTKKTAGNFLLPGFLLTIHQAAIPDKGEDSYCYSFCEDAGMLAVFDGCGGLGARRHPCYTDNTEAYMASRLCAGAFYDSFQHLFPEVTSTQQDAELSDQVPAKYAEAVRNFCKEVLHACKPPESDISSIRGSMVKTLPTTAAAVLVQPGKQKNELLIDALWAGDSRVYLLDANGLAQLTIDDASISDPMENLYEDGILSNVLCQGRPPKLRHSGITASSPALVFAATDGCFGYFSTPMEFEGILLRTMLDSTCIAEWEQRLRDCIGSVAGDDFTLMLAAYGFSGFDDMRNLFKPRLDMLYLNYLNQISQLELTDIQSRRVLWSTYRSGYFRYLKDDT